MTTDKTTYEYLMNLKLDEDGGLPSTYDEKTKEIIAHPPLEIPPAPAGVNDEAWQCLHQGFRTTFVNIGLQLKAWYDENDQLKTKSIFQMTELERLQWCAETVLGWQEEDKIESLALDELEAQEEGVYQTERDIARARNYYSGGGKVGLDPFAYDNQGYDTGLRTSDFI